LTAFAPHLAQVIAEQVLPHLPRAVHLGAARFEVGEPITDSARHRWAGMADANALIDKWFSASRRIEKRFALEFASPTAYRQIHRNILVPNPVGIFPGYLAAWNANCQPRFEEDLIALVEAEVAISRYALRTQVVDFGEYREAGWVGQCGFTVFSEEIALRRVIHLLADFAFYCGTGYKTTHGMGMTRKV
jgi:CRISPR-associated endoribonuclease Cas6